MDPHAVLTTLNLNSLLQKVESCFLEFLQAFKLEDGAAFSTDPYYVAESKRLLIEKRYTLWVDLIPLDSVSESAVSFKPAELKSVIVSQLSLVQHSLTAALRTILMEHEDSGGRIANAQQEFMVSFCGLPGSLRIGSAESKHLGRLSEIQGTVVYAAEVKCELRVAVCKCERCGHQHSVAVEELSVDEPRTCPMQDCHGRSTLQVGSHSNAWRDSQKLKLQVKREHPLPLTLDVILLGEHCDSCKVGDSVCLSGCLITLPENACVTNPADTGRALKQRRLNHRFTFIGAPSQCGQLEAGNALHHASAPRSSHDSLPPRMAGHLDRNAIFVRFVQGIAPSVYGHLQAKSALLLMLIGGSRKAMADGKACSGKIHMCLLGNAASAKSVLLKWIVAFRPNSPYVSGTSATAAGLTAALLPDETTGNRVLKPGALMAAADGVCCIDDFELMDASVQEAIREALGQESITFTKAGLHTRLNVTTAVLAAFSCVGNHTKAAGTERGKLTMPNEFANFFDLVLPVANEESAEDDVAIVHHILSSQQCDFSAVPMHLIYQYVKDAQRIQPEITTEAGNRLAKCYAELRRNFSGVTPRHLETHIKLSEAYARAHLEDKVTLEHVERAFAFMRTMFGRIAWTSTSTVSKPNRTRARVSSRRPRF